MTKKVPREDLKFAKLFLGKLNENDFQILHKSHFEYKNKISEKASPDTIDGYFDYHEVEYNGLMSAYNDILPYGDQFLVTIKGEQCIIFDQYCLLPKCPMHGHQFGYNFNRQIWEKRVRNYVLLHSITEKSGGSWLMNLHITISLETVKTAIERTAPGHL